MIDGVSADIKNLVDINIWFGTVFKQTFFTQRVSVIRHIRSKHWHFRGADFSVGYCDSYCHLNVSLLLLSVIIPNSRCIIAVEYSQRHVRFTRITQPCCAIITDGCVIGSQKHSKIDHMLASPYSQKDRVNNMIGYALVSLY